MTTLRLRGRQALPWPPRAVVRGDLGMWALQRVLHRKGLGPVAGVDEAGRGACAGPLVVAACVLRPADAAALVGL
ncbi:MAG: ribonuclease HII, partial [Pseudonocardiaceae bacterium]